MRPLSTPGLSGSVSWQCHLASKATTHRQLHGRLAIIARKVEGGAHRDQRSDSFLWRLEKEQVGLARNLLWGQPAGHRQERGTLQSSLRWSWQSQSFKCIGQSRW